MDSSPAAPTPSTCVITLLGAQRNVGLWPHHASRSMAGRGRSRVADFDIRREDFPVLRVLGVDACKTGWFGIAPDGPKAYVAATISELVEQAEADGPVTVVGIDIPIGLPDTSRRQADVLAKQAVGPLRSSVFITPVRPALEAVDHRTANEINRKLAGEGISVQAFRLKPKLDQVEAWARTTHHRVVEVHPEVTFAELAGHPLTASKHTWAGAELRRGLLEDAGLELRDLGTPGRLAGVDDVLDAAAVAWTAHRVAFGRANARPDPPEIFSDGWPSAIWT